MQWKTVATVLGSLLMHPGTALAWQGATQPEATVATACPAPARPDPVYPAGALQSQKSGTVLLDLQVDGCGRVIVAKVKTGSGIASLDQAALVAASKWVVDPKGVVGSSGGHVQIPVDFNTASHVSMPFSKPDWPASHKRPRYVLEPLRGYGTPLQVLERYPFDIGKKYQPPYPSVRNIFFRQGGPDSNEYWLFMYVAADPTIAVRYKLVMENGEPVVRMAFLCSGGVSQCKRDRKVLLRGLPFARDK
jgi:TonB family protein